MYFKGGILMYFKEGIKLGYFNIFVLYMVINFENINNELIK